jgi:hypothetical protein
MDLTSRGEIVCYDGDFLSLVGCSSSGLVAFAYRRLAAQWGKQQQRIGQQQGPFQYDMSRSE